MAQQYIFIGAMVMIFYFFMIRPQHKKSKEHKNFLAKIKKGDEVATIGGIYGKVYEIEEKFIILEIDSSGSKMKVSLEAISQAFSRDK